MLEYEEFVRMRITELRLAMNVSEHKMSLDLDKSGAYIRSITSGASLPSLRELFNIIRYFDLTPPEFFAPLDRQDSTYHKICHKLRDYNENNLDKVSIFLELIE